MFLISSKSALNSTKFGSSTVSSVALWPSMNQQHLSYISKTFSLCVSTRAQFTVNRLVVATFFLYLFTVLWNIPSSTSNSIADLRCSYHFVLTSLSVMLLGTGFNSFSISVLYQLNVSFEGEVFFSNLPHNPACLSTE